MDSEEEIIYDYIPFDNNTDNDDDNGQNKKKNTKKDNKFNNIKTKNNEPKNEKKNKKNKNNKKKSDKEYFAIEDGKSFKEDENEYRYNNLNNFTLSNSNNCYDIDILSDNKIEFDILNSYSKKPFLKTNISNYYELKKICFDDIIAFKLKLRKYKINAFIEKVRFGINNLDIDSN